MSPRVTAAGVGLALLAAVASCRRADPPPAVAPEAEAPYAPITLHDLTFGGRPPPERYADDVYEEADRVIDSLESCYAAALLRSASVGGAHALRLWVSARRVIRVTTESTELADDELERCVKQALLDYDLPPQVPDSGVRVRFRLVFAPPPAGAGLRCEGGACEPAPCGAPTAVCCPGGVCHGVFCRDGTCSRP